MNITAILLAAGESRRMGCQKLLLPFAGKTVIEHIVEQLRNTPLDSIVVVTGTDREGVEAALRSHAVRFAHNPNVEEGMLSSIRVGLVAAPASDGFLVVLGDQPSIQPDVVATLCQSYQAFPQGIHIPTHEGRRGHPILVSMTYKDEILSNYDTEGLRGLVTAHAVDVREVPFDHGAILRDMDYPEDYQRELAFLRSQSS